MKKFSLLLNVLLIGFIGFQSFNGGKDNEDSQLRCNRICTDYSSSNTPFKINSNVLKMMSANYVYGQTPVNSSQVTTDDAKTAWFSLSTLKRFLWQVESQVCSNIGNCKNVDSLGIRIYYARYPENASSNGVSIWNQYHTDLSTVPLNYQKQHTFFMVPTFDIDGVHQDFDPYTAKYQKCKPTTLNDLLGAFKMSKENIKMFSTTNSIMIGGLTVDPDPAAKNHSELCPPNAQGGSTCPGAYFQ